MIGVWSIVLEMSAWKGSIILSVTIINLILCKYFQTPKKIALLRQLHHHPIEYYRLNYFTLRHTKRCQIGNCFLISCINKGACLKLNFQYLSKMWQTFSNKSLIVSKLKIQLQLWVMSTVSFMIWSKFSRWGGLLNKTSTYS